MEPMVRWGLELAESIDREEASTVEKESLFVGEVEDAYLNGLLSEEEKGKLLRLSSDLRWRK